MTTSAGSHTQRRPAGWDFAAAGMIEDAEFETIHPARGRAAPRIDMAHRKARTGLPPGLGILNRRAFIHSSRGKAEPIWLAAAVCAVVGLSLLSGTFLPGALASLGGGTVPHALRIEGVSAEIDREAADGLFVSGVVRNEGGDTLTAPPLVVTVARRGEVVARYYLGTNGHRLAPHEGFKFSGRLPTPAGGAGKVDVRFNRDRSGN